MFEARVRDGLILKHMMIAIKDVFELVKWFSTPNGISLMATDVSKVSLLRLRLEREMFDTYRCDRNVSFAMKTSSLWKVLKYVTTDERIRFEFGQRSNQIDVTVEPMCVEDSTKYEIYLIDYDITDMDINPDQFERTASIRMPSSKLQRICRDLAQIGENITIGCTQEKVKFFTKGEIGSGCVKVFPTFFVDEPHIQVQFDVKEPITQAFKLKILSQLTKATPLTSQVIIHLRAVGPIELIYDIKTVKVRTDDEINVCIGSLAVLRLYLAPNIDNEE